MLRRGGVRLQECECVCVIFGPCVKVGQPRPPAVRPTFPPRLIPQEKASLLHLSVV